MKQSMTACKFSPGEIRSRGHNPTSHFHSDLKTLPKKVFTKCSLERLTSVDTIKGCRTKYWLIHEVWRPQCKTRFDKPFRRRSAQLPRSAMVRRLRAAIIRLLQPSGNCGAPAKTQWLVKIFLFDCIIVAGSWKSWERSGFTGRTRGGEDNDRPSQSCWWVVGAGGF